jgi:AcrR family transcriptional regulator
MIDVAVDTKTRILDAAEKLFGQKGFDVTSLRDITTEAQVNLAAVNYHFQSKDSLIDAVIERRILPVNQRRLEMLETAGPSPSVERILEAFMVPTLEADLATVIPLMGRVLTNPDQFVEWLYKKRLSGTADRFMEALCQALPHVPRPELFWRLHFVAGAMSHVLLFSRALPILTNGLCDLSDRSALAQRLIAFGAAGLRAPLPDPRDPEAH